MHHIKMKHSYCLWNLRVEWGSQAHQEGNNISCVESQPRDTYRHLLFVCSSQVIDVLYSQLSDEKIEVQRG